MSLFLKTAAAVIFFCVMMPAPFCTGAEEAQKTITNSIGMEFVKVEPGKFSMGSPDDEPYRGDSEKLHQVSISKPFYIQTTEVTLGQWWAVMGKKWLFPRRGSEEMPVTEVSWHDCQEFIDKLNRLEGEEGGYRLPTEAEWEYSCRAGSETPYAWGEEIDCSQAMFGNNRYRSDECMDYARSKGLAPNSPAPVKSYPPNDWGLYDMHCNVWEWTEDCFDSYTEQAVSGIFECSRRVRRGGSWYNEDYYCRCANRAYAHPSARFKTTGFRLVKEAP